MVSLSPASQPAQHAPLNVALGCLPYRFADGAWTEIPARAPDPVGLVAPTPLG